MKLFFKHLFTGTDNNTFDVGRVSWAASFLVVATAAFANFWHGAIIDIQAFAIALSAIAGSHGAALWAKKDTEPPPKE